MADGQYEDQQHTNGQLEETNGTNYGAELLDQVRAALVRYVVLPSPEALDAATLWIAATHAQPYWAHAARLVIRAPEKRCGKSRLLDLVRPRPDQAPRSPPRSPGDPPCIFSASR